MISQLKRRLSRKSLENDKSSASTVVSLIPELEVSPLPTPLLVPPVPELLHSNSAPSELEESLINLSISQARKERRRVAKQVRVAKQPNQPGSLEAAHKKEIQLSNFIQTHKGILSTFRRLPVEILQHIFLCLVLDFPDSWGDNTHSVTARYHRFIHGTESPWLQNRRSPVVFTLSRVCRHWREVALVSPCLWAQLPLIELKKTKSVIKRQLKVLKMFIERSQGLPLDVLITAPERFPETPPVLALLIEHCQKWEMFRIDADVSVLRALQPVKDRLPCLMSLTVNRVSGGSSIDENYFKIFSSAPKLEEFRHSGFYRFEVKAIVPPGYHFIRYSSQWIHNLPQTLQSLSLSDLGKFLELKELSCFTLPCLVQLDMEWCKTPGPERQSAHFLTYATLPAIRDIRIMARHDGTQIIQDLTKMLLRSPGLSPLRRLYFHSSNTELEEGLADLLKAAPALTELNIIIPSPTIILLLASVCPESDVDTVLVSHLRSCTFRIHDPITEKTAEALKSLAISRCEANQQRQQASVFDLSPMKVRRLRDLRIEVCLDSNEASRRLRTIYHLQRSALRLWETSYEYHERDSHFIHNCNARLSEALYWLPGWREVKDSSAKTASKEDRARVLEILDDIESEPLHLRHVRGIFSSNIHVLLYDLARFWQDGKIPVRQTCWRILAKWKAFVKANILYVSFDWAFDRQSPRGGLCHIYENHPCRETARKFSDALIYGIGGKPE